jgi:general stress protein YciG
MEDYIMADSKTNNDNSMTTSEAGKMGGEKVKEERGAEFYSEIGQKQGKENNPGNFANRPKDEVRAAAAEGGRNSHKNDNATDGDDDTSKSEG